MITPLTLFLARCVRYRTRRCLLAGSSTRALGHLLLAAPATLFVAFVSLLRPGIRPKLAAQA